MFQNVFIKGLVNSGQTGYARRYPAKVENCEKASSETGINGKCVNFRKPQWMNLTLEPVLGQ